MSTRRRIIFHLVGWPVLVFLLIAAGQSRVEAIAAADPAGEVRSVPVYVQSRPVYSKPAPPKPKVVLPKLPTSVATSQAKNNKEGKADPNLVTQTVYGFLDFVTTIGNTVMIFTPQTKKAELVKPSSSVELTPTSSTEIASVLPTAVVEIATEKSTSISSSSSRQPKLISMEDSIPIIESSEYEPQIQVAATPANIGRTSSLDLEYVNLMSEALLQEQEQDHTAEGSFLSSVFEPLNAEPLPSVITPEVQVRTLVNVVTGEVKSSSDPPPTPSKGFTLKFSKASSVVALSSSKITPPKPKSQPKPSTQEPTGILNQIFDTQVTEGTTTVHETKIIGTYLGDQYARVLESSSTILPVITPSKPPPALPTTPKLKISKPQSLHIVEKSSSIVNIPVTPEPVVVVSHIPEVHTEKSISSSSDDFEDDDQFHDEHPDDIFAEPSSSIIVEPTPTASEEQTLYVLPQKEPKAELYVSPVPNNNAYSRQPQFFVDVSPAKSFDFIVTATPTRKQFRQLSGKPGTNRFSQRFSNTNSRGQPPQTSTESNELTAASQSVESSPEESSSRRSSPTRFRSRNRAGGRQSNEAEALPTVSVYSKTISATPSRRFSPSTRGRGGKFAANEKTFQEPVTFKTAQNARGFGASSTRQILPTSSSSIYRFKLNRPTGRWRFKPSPKPKVNIIKTKDEDELTTQASSNNQAATQPLLQQQPSGPVYLQNLAENGDIQNFEESRTESNELVQDGEPELLPQTIRVATITPTEFADLDKFLEIATIRSPYVFQAGNVKNTRYITLTKTFTKENIQPTQASVVEATLENILATRPPYEKILEGSSDVATLPVIALSGDQATPPLETVTQTFSTTQLMLKTSILPVLYDGVTTLYTLTQSYFITRLVTAHKTVPPIELFQFVPTKSLNEFNTALQEAGSENREHLLASESEADENDTNYEHILAPPDELTSVGSDFDPSSMDDKFPRAGPSGQAAKAKSLNPRPKSTDVAGSPQLPDLNGLTPEQVAILRYFNQAPTGNSFFPQGLLPSQPQFELTSSPVVVDTTATVVETKTLRILFGAKPTFTTLFQTKVVPTRMTSYVTSSVPVKPTAAIPNFFQPAPFPLAYVG
ncbi:unnamed protein product [Allacma fusca]|uniref:DUF4758 domain-containing protein n=1 Tax=Allacma fusca TaxID=39272 RepID=A0A8J2PRQ9_9HEXA|nr:unnamed protein product [Allacma fusca]